MKRFIGWSLLVGIPVAILVYMFVTVPGEALAELALIFGGVLATVGLMGLGVYLTGK